jgi:hypothetical protein
MYVTNNELDHFEEKICKNYTDFLVKKVGSGSDLAETFQIRPDTDPQHCIRISLKKAKRIRLCFKTAWAFSIGTEELKEYLRNAEAKHKCRHSSFFPVLEILNYLRGLGTE